MSETTAPYLVDEKRVALVEFLSRLEAEHGNDVLRVILFGSHARGDADEESDVDVLVVARGDVETAQRVHHWCNENHTSWVSPLVISQDDYQDDQRFKPPFYVTLRRDGIELWNPEAQHLEERQIPLDFTEGEFRMLDYETIMTIRSYLRDLQEYQKESAMLEREGFVRGAVASLYYAAFSITTAALYTMNIVRGKHSGVESAVSQFLVKPGLLEEEYHALFAKLQRGRLSAHYGTQMKLKGEIPISEDEMPQLLRDGERYIERMKKFLIERGVDESDFKA